MNKNKLKFSIDEILEQYRGASVARAIIDLDESNEMIEEKFIVFSNKIKRKININEFIQEGSFYCINFEDKEKIFEKK